MEGVNKGEFRRESEFVFEINGASERLREMEKWEFSQRCVDGVAE